MQARLSRLVFGSAACLLAAAPALAHAPDELGEPPPPPFLAPPVAAGSPDAVVPRALPGQTLPLKPARKIAFDVDEGTWMSVDLSPDGHTIVFDLLGDLYAMPSAGGQAKAITRGLAFDSQPTFSPDGRLIAFLSDRSGAENLWVAKPDGTGLRQISWRDDNAIFASPAWSADGKSLYVSRYLEALQAYELLRFDLDGQGDGEAVVRIKATPDQPRTGWTSAIGAAASADGRYLYYAAHVGEVDLDKLPQWTIRRRDLKTGAEETIVSSPTGARPDMALGSAFRPAISPDGRTLVYGVHQDGQTGLRVRDLSTGADRWLAYPVDQDELQAANWRDILPRYAFTPDGKALIVAYGGKIRKLDIGTGRDAVLPFKAHVDLDVGPFLRREVKQETGPVRVRLIQTPIQSPDGRTLAFSALGRVYLMDLKEGATPRPLVQDATPQFHPSWSPDGKSLVYVTWTATDGGHVWSAPADGSSPPRRLTQAADFYTNPAFTPDGRSVLAVRSSNSERMHTYMEFGILRNAALVSMPVAGGTSVEIARGRLGGRLQFTDDPAHVFVDFADGLNAVALDGSGRRRVVQVTGPGWYFADGRAGVDNLKISPDGKWLLAQITQQLHVLAMPPGDQPLVDLGRPGVAHRKLTDVGADFFDWSRDGHEITWAVGSTFYRRPLAAVALNAPDAPGGTADAPKPGQGGVEAFPAMVEVPRDTPRGTVVLRGATALTMKGDQVIADADILVTDDHIVAVGARGTVAIPPGAAVRDLSGKFVTPGFIDTHDHLADIRRDVLDPKSWGAAANLAYGVTTGFDPSSLSIDMFAYEDMVDAGMMMGSRIHTTGPALFSFNEFASQAEADAVVSRYASHYRTGNLKEYRVGNRRARQWVAQAARDQGVVPTTEGALSMKLDLTQILDGYAGNEHALVDPLFDDVVQLVARTRVSYTLTLQITNGGGEGEDYYIARNAPHADLKYNHFVPHYAVDLKLLQRPWRDPKEYRFPRLAADAAKIVRAGGLLGVGSHGEVPGLGYHWEMQAYASGGMTSMEVLHAATIGSAETIGRDAEFGSLEPGKYADLVVLDKDPRLDIANTLSISQVMKNGRLYDAATLDEVWPRQKPLEPRWFWNDPQATPRP